MTIFHDKLLTKESRVLANGWTHPSSMTVFINLFIYTKCHPKSYDSDIKHRMTLNMRLRRACRPWRRSQTPTSVSVCRILSGDGWRKTTTKFIPKATQGLGFSFDFVTAHLLNLRRQPLCNSFVTEPHNYLPSLSSSSLQDPGAGYYVSLASDVGILKQKETWCARNPASLSNHCLIRQPQS
jgi:hypothetical protein